MKRPLALWLLILAVAAAVRLPPLTAGLPYMTYVDEGHVLHQAVHLLAEKTWAPREYYYPSFPIYLIAASAAAYSPVYSAVHGRPLREDLSPSPPQYYDILEPPELIVIGRLVTLAFSLGVVLLSGLLARRLAGDAAGLAAAWLAALVPALVARGAIITVNPHVAFFTLAALYFAEGAREGARQRRDAVLAGVMTGLAAVCKYPAVLVCLPVALAVLLSDASRIEKLRRLVLAGAASAATALAAMPPLALRTDEVLWYMNWISGFYSRLEFGSYWHQAVHRAEWDLPLNAPEIGLPLMILAAAGLVVAVLDRRWTRSLWGWLLFGAASGALLVPYGFRPFRNLLAFVPLACVLAALLYARLREKVSRPLWLDLAAAALPLVLFAPALNGYIRPQLTLEDSREQAIRWLAGRAGPRDKILVAEELAVLPDRVASLKGTTEVLRWGQAKKRVYGRRYHYLVLGEVVTPRGSPKIGDAARAVLLRNYRLAAEFGSQKTHFRGDLFRGNQQVIYILRRTPRPDRAGKVGGRRSLRPGDPPAGSHRRAEAIQTTSARLKPATRSKWRRLRVSRTPPW